ncbi:MAG TPA: TIGR03619 family F420-dependent LLM class oxidoreductase [Nitrolancea sp.]|nr:TIGR03619 family F420-dependent LLM class oxidoreductase [Nitrolancea sp.]
MKVGVNLLNYGPGASPASLLRWSRLAEALGYHFLMISDHVALTPDVARSYPAPFYDPFLSLAWLAGRTRTVELGTTVIILPYRHPLQVARLASNLDQLSGGRFIFGVGAGWAAQEFAALGLSVNERGAMTDEYLEVIQATWAGEVASYHGRFVAFDAVETGPPPLQRPHPPLWIGGNGPAARRRAIRFDAAWHPISIRLPWLRDEALPDLRAQAAAAGKPVPALCPRIRLHLTERPLDEAERRAGEGTLAQVRADLQELDELGASYVLLDTYRGDPAGTLDHEHAWSMLATLAEQVLDLPNQRLR